MRVGRSWELRLEFHADPDLVAALTSVLNALAEDIASAPEMREYDSLGWSIRQKIDADDGDSVYGLEVMMSRSGRDRYGFGMPVNLDNKYSAFTIADEFHTHVLDDRVLWPNVDGKILSPGLINGDIVWQHRGQEYAKVGELRSILG
ncbi:hypothetical protein [Rhodococcus opacus]|uniref:hypothetical protein n=1 Tax=Rhodococcus opacus TaxID=37919 RepID=UPI002235A27F|nr:hypothetical protein [Rhodococcus opacus]UZG58939.1 hypothetical protein ONE62_17285 [Rhodococcus opacus]